MTVSKNQRRCQPILEGLEPRLTMSKASPTGIATLPAAPGAPEAGGGQGTLAVLEAFSQAYLSRVGDPNYNPTLDLNHNGQIGQEDGRLLLHSLPPLSPKIPLTLGVTLSSKDKAKGHVPKNSGGVTHSKDPTVLGHTTPGALVFTGTGTLDLKLRGPVVVADANGNFSLKVDLTDGINQLDFQAVDPYGRQTLRAFPIYWLDFARYENAHPAKT
jgi:hypothetical protein